MPLTKAEPGVFTGTLKTDEIGLFQITEGDLSALAHVGPVNAPEFADSVSTMARLEPIAKATGGSVRRLRSKRPASRGSRAGHRAGAHARAAAGPDWIGLVSGNATALKSVNHTPLFSGLLGLALFLFAVGSMWWREGR